jgi:hypothetical protein
MKNQERCILMDYDYETRHEYIDDRVFLFSRRNCEHTKVPPCQKCEAIARELLSAEK